MNRPPLMLVSERPMSPEVADRIRTAMRNASEWNHPVTVVDGRLKVYQLVDGKWLPLDSSDPPPAEDATRTVTETGA